MWHLRLSRRDVPLIESTRLNGALGVIYALMVIAYFVSAEGWVDYTGHVIGRDFGNLWTAGRLVASGNFVEVFDQPAFSETRAQLLAAGRSDYNWSYPPHMLLIAVPFGVLGYPLALAPWSAITLGLYLSACRRTVLLLAPATLANLFSGQTGFLVAGLLVGGLRLLDRHPILAGVVLGLASIKPQLGILVPVALVALRAWRAIFSATVTVVLLVALSGAVFGWEVWRIYVETTAPLQAQILETGRGLFNLMMPSAFRSARVVGMSATYAYLMQAPFMLIAVVMTYRTFRRGGGPEGLALAVFLLASVIATPYVHNYDLTLTSYAVLLILSDGRRDGYWFGERAVLSMVWFLPLAVIPLNAAGVPVGYVVLAASLGLAAARARSTGAGDG